jgi:smad nuclear-interacting protein 1
MDNDFKKPKNYEYGKVKLEKKEEPVEKEKPNLGLSGNLCKDTNTFNGVIVKYNEPPEARKPKKRWRLYCFKGKISLKVKFLFNPHTHKTK